MKNIKYLLLLLVLFGVSFSQPVAAYNFAPPIEPVAKQKITLKSVKSTLALQKAKWQAVQAKPNKTTTDSGEILLIAGLLLVAVALIGLPLGYGLGVLWLWISSLSILGLVGLLLMFLLIVMAIDYNPTQKMAGLGVALISLLILIFLLLLLIDISIMAIIAWLPWFWIVFGAIALLMGLLILLIFSLD